MQHIYHFYHTVPRRATLNPGQGRISSESMRTVFGAFKNFTPKDDKCQGISLSIPETIKS